MQPTDTQYQHFIPQFILKKFSHPFVCPDTPQNKSRCKKHHHEKGKHPGDQVVNCLRLTPIGFTTDEYPPRRICGLYDMYTDKRGAAQLPRLLETKFSGLEGQASRIIRKIVKAHQLSKDSITLIRTERDLLRKFLFLLIYRGPGYYRRYNHETIEDYHHSDQPTLKKFMAKHNLQRPVDAWLHSLNGIIDLKMYVGEAWAEQVHGAAYYHIASDFIEHMTSYWIALCTPGSEDQEFILTDTGYNVYEGPTIHYQDRETGERAAISPRFHYFAPIAPRLSIVLRSSHLPEQWEDANPDVKAKRELLRWMMVEGPFGQDTKSLLEDMPVHKAFNNYLRVVDGRLIPKPGWNGQLGPKDEFLFPFFKIETHQIRIINGLLIDHAFHGSTIVFKRKVVFLDLLQWYLEEPCEVGKNLSKEHHDAKKEYITHLAQFMEGEGREVTAKMTSWPTQHNINLKRLREVNMEMAEWNEESSQRESNEANEDCRGDINTKMLVEQNQDQRVDPDSTSTSTDSPERNDTSVAEKVKGISTPEIPAEVLKASLVMFQVWVRNAELNFKGDFPTTGRLQVLLSAYQERQPSPKFWAFLKQFRYAIWESNQDVEGQNHDPRSWDEACIGPEDGVVTSVCATKPSDLNAMMWEVFITDVCITPTMHENLNLAELTASLLRIGGRVHVVSSKLEEISQDIKNRVPPTKQRKTSLIRTQESPPAGDIYPGPSWLFVLFILLWSVLFVLLIPLDA